MLSRPFYCVYPEPPPGPPNRNCWNADKAVPGWAFQQARHELLPCYFIRNRSIGAYLRAAGAALYFTGPVEVKNKVHQFIPCRAAAAARLENTLVQTGSGTINRLLARQTVTFA